LSVSTSTRQRDKPIAKTSKQERWITDDAELSDQLLGDRSLVQLELAAVVELLQLGPHRRSARLAHVRLGEKKVGGQVAQRHGRPVGNGEVLHAHQHDVLGNLQPQALHPHH
jgi:hypothetical protein